MKKYIILLILAVFVIVNVGGVALDKGFSVTKIAGKAYDGNNNLLYEGRIIYPGESINTKDGGQVVLTADDTTTIRIGPYSNVELKEKTDNLTNGESHTGIVVWTGRIFGRVQKLLNDKSTFKITTPTSVAGIRGTTFAVDVNNDGTTKVAVYTGRVAVTKRGQQEDDILVKSKEEISLAPSDNKLGTPKAIDLSKLDSWGKDALEDALIEESKVVQAEIERDLTEVQIKRLEKMLQKVNNTIEGQQEKMQDKNGQDNNGSNSSNNKGNNDLNNRSNNGNKNGNNNSNNGSDSGNNSSYNGSNNGNNSSNISSNSGNNNGNSNKIK